jgi:hypothetical protein
MGGESSLERIRVPGSERRDEETGAINIAHRTAIDKEMLIIVDENR